ncbi:hypothetical protein [Luedemannella helvata]|uniref:Uncharacterized protein n=1 Tax=Luedemannella helvata TaxID=349315 RepID=A0ABN2KKS6_9ACTN
MALPPRPPGSFWGWRNEIPDANPDEDAVHERLPWGKIRINCNCCSLWHIASDSTGAVPVLCDQCRAHQGNLPEKQLSRLQEHEVMLRDELATVRRSEAALKAALARAKEQTRAALASRGELASRLVSAAHETGNHHCAAHMLASEPDVRSFARRHVEIKRGLRRDDDYDDEP